MWTLNRASALAGISTSNQRATMAGVRLAAVDEIGYPPPILATYRVAGPDNPGRCQNGRTFFRKGFGILGLQGDRFGRSTPSRSSTTLFAPRSRHRFCVWKQENPNIRAQ
jgi:hypothetical protein